MAKILYIDNYSYGMCDAYFQSCENGYDIYVFMMSTGEPVQLYKDDVTLFRETDKAISVYCY